MLGAITGDIIGSRFEFNNYKGKDFKLFTQECCVTDDSILTICVAKALLECKDNFSWNKVYCNTIKYMREIGSNYPNCGFGGGFYRWMYKSTEPAPYNSFGNGAGMRISPVAYVAKTLNECEKTASIVTMTTHNHPEGIKGGMVIAGCIWLAKNKATKEEIEAYAEEYYFLPESVDIIRENYSFNEISQSTMPQAIRCFLDSTNFEDCIRNCISIGGDSDTIAAIAGAIAEAYYGIPEEIETLALTYIPKELLPIVLEFREKYVLG